MSFNFLALYMNFLSNKFKHRNLDIYLSAHEAFIE
jgi:hypothetical protein